MKTRRADTFSLLTIAILAGVFFWKFFFPTPQLLVTPDFGGSDVFALFGFPGKYFLSQNLKQSTLPLWSSKAGGGFPVFAEGQTGTFFLPNSILFKFLDPVIAYNLALVLVPITIGWGMYVWLRLMGLRPLPSWFGGVTLAFSGPVITQLPHVTLLQGFSVLPWVMIATHQLTQKKSWVWVVVLALVISQQIFAGFPQASFITILFASGYYVWFMSSRVRSDGVAISLIIKIASSPAEPDPRNDKNTVVWNLLRFATAILLALGLSAIQMLPSYEFLQNSTARGGFSPSDAAYFSYPFKHLITLLDPFRLGNPKFGTYPDFTKFDGSIFWENTGFIGILPLLFVTASLFSLKRRGLTRVALFFFISLGMSFLLMLGSHSPFYIVYSLPIFNLFRVPSRFLWIFVTSLVIVAAMGIPILTQKLTKGVLVILIVLHVMTLMKTWENYHAIAPAGNWTTSPAITQLLVPNKRVYTIGSEFTHNQSFLTKGWQDMKPYEDLRDALFPNSNLLWNITSSQVNAGRFLRRGALVDALLSDLLSVRDNVATVSSQTKKLLDVFSTQQIISTVPLVQEGFQPVGSIRKEKMSIQVYDNKESLPHSYLAGNAVVAQTFEESVRKLQEKTFVPGKSILVEQPIELPEGESGGEANVVNQSDTTVTIAVAHNRQPAVLVLADTFYPGWNAFVDGKPASIFPVNIRHRGVVVDAGDHTVVFTYDPVSFKTGAAITTGTLLVIVMVFLLSFATARTHQKVSARGLDRRNNPDR